MVSVSERALHLALDLGVTQQEILAINPARRYCLLVNDSDTDCYISLGVPAALNTGIRLNSSGGAYEINATNLFSGRIYAISSGATKRLMVTEY